MIFYVNKNKKIIVGRNNQMTNILPDLDFHTIGQLSFSFIDDKNKIQDIDTALNYYFAGKLKDILFISTEYSIDNNVITFTVDTYTEPFLDEITKRNTEIEIEIGSNTDGVQKIFLRDYAFAQPRVYIEGLNPSKIDLGDYYTKAEIDSMFAEIDIPDKLSELDNDTGFITVNDIPEQSGGFSKTEPIFLYPQTQQNPQNNGDGTWSYSNTLSPEIPASVSSPTQQYVGDTVSKFTKTYTWDMEPDFEISPIDSLSWVMGTMGTNGKSAFVGKLYVDDVLIRETENLVSIPNRNSGFGFIVEFNNIYHTENVKGTVLKVELIYTKTNYNLGYLYGDACINYRYYENVLYYKTSAMQGIGGLAKNINVALYFPEYNTIQYIKNENTTTRNLVESKIPKYAEESYNNENEYLTTQDYRNYKLAFQNLRTQILTVNN